MTFDAYRLRCEALFPFKFEDALCSDSVDELLRHAVDKALSKFEKIDNIEVAGSQVISNALSIVKCVPAKTVNTFNVFDFIKSWPGEYIKARPIPIQYYFIPTERKLILEWDTSVYVEYVVDPATLSITDLTSQYTDWAVKYGIACVKEKEGMMGKGATLDAIPYSLNYEDLLSQGQEEKRELEESLEDMYFGLFGAKV